MNVARAVAKVLKQEGVKFLIAYPVNPIIEAAAEEDIRTIIVRQERIGIHMADAVSKLSSGDMIGIFAMQHGPGSENAFGGVAQSYADSVPVIILPAGHARSMTNVMPNFSSLVSFQSITKSAEQVTLPQEVPNAIRRAFTQARNGRPGPCLVEIPTDVLAAEYPGELQYHPALKRLRSAADPELIREAAQMLLRAKHPVIYAGQGVHYARAWDALRELAELLEAPVTTSIEGKSAFPEDHPLSLQSGGRSISRELHEFLTRADVVLGIGASFTNTNYGINWRKYAPGKQLIQSTIDTADLHKDQIVACPVPGDAKLVLEALIVELRKQISGPRGRREGIVTEIATLHKAWLEQWMPKLTHAGTPINPYRVIWDLLHTVDRDNTILTHDAGSPRDQLTPFWRSTTPLSYLGWGKTTQLGYGLGLAMGAKLAHPEKLCINWWGDAAIGFTGMDFETAVRERIPILSLLSNNFSMAIELKIMQVATEKYRSTDISGNYADFARALGGYGERVTDPAEIIPALRRGIQKTQAGIPTLLEFITSKEEEVSLF